MNMLYAHYWTPGVTPFPLAGVVMPLLALALVWTIILKGFALWYAARGHQKWWFIALLLVNTLGILEIVYLIWFRPTTRDTHAPAHNSSAGA